jgi:hypothetical protein
MWSPWVAVTLIVGYFLIVISIFVQSMISIDRNLRNRQAKLREFKQSHSRTGVNEAFEIMSTDEMRGPCSTLREPVQSR